MNSGRLRHRICIKYPDTDQDDYGESVRTWELFKKVWSDIRNKKETESIQADKVTAKSTHTAKIRYLGGLTSEMRIYWGTRIFEIDGWIADRTDAKYQIIFCTELNG